MGLIGGNLHHMLNLSINSIVGNLVKSYVSKNVKSIESKVTDKIDLHYKAMYEEQLQKNEQQMKIEQQKLNLLKFIAVMQVLILICVIIRILY